MWGTCGRGDMAPRLPSTPALCPPWLLRRRRLREVGGVERDLVLGVTRILGGDGGLVQGTRLAKDVGTCPFYIRHRKWHPQMPESPQHVATPVCSH